MHCVIHMYMYLNIAEIGFIVKRCTHVALSFPAKKTLKFYLFAQLLIYMYIRAAQTASAMAARPSSTLEHSTSVQQALSPHTAALL